MRRSFHSRPERPCGQVVLALVTTLLLLTGCEKSPTSQHQGNPFDPSGPSGGDALQLTTVTGVNQIILTWNQPQDMDINEYSLYHSESGDGSYEQLAIVPAGTNSTGSYTYKYPSPTQTHWFKAQAFTLGGDFSLTSLAVAAAATLGPTVVVGDTVSSLASRFPELTVTATFGDSLLVALNDTYANAWRFAQAGSGVPTTFSLDLGSAAADSTFTIYVKAIDGASSSFPTVLEMPVSFNPTHGLVDASATRLAKRVNDLSIPATGVTRMRFAPSEAELASATWVPGADIYPDYELSDSANSQEIWGEYEGDFGFISTSKLVVRPDLLGAASFELSLPTNRVVYTPTVMAQLSAAATEMRISENPDFASVPWQTFADTSSVRLSDGEGTKTVYCQFRNDWTQSAILSDYCIYVSQGLDVKILAPGTGAVVPGGVDFIVMGTSNPGTVATAIDSVKLDLGDGLGFREVIGVDSWQLEWAIPTFDQDTELVLRARAWADTFMITDVVTVTISQLAIRIMEPLPDATVVGGDPLVISGEAAGLLGGAPIDSVTVDIGAEHLLANGTDAWTVTWTTPVVTTDTPTDITATVWAGAESTASLVSVILTP